MNRLTRCHQAPPIVLSTLVAFGLCAATARADDSPAPDQPQMVDGGGTRHEIDRTSLYGDDARIPLPMTVIATSSLSYTNIGSDPTQVSSPYPKEGAGCYNSAGIAQPCYSTFSNNTAQPGGQMILTGEVGLLPRFSVLGNIMVGAGGGAGVPSPNLGGTVAARFQVFPDSWTQTHFVVSGGYVREAWNPPVYDDDKTPAVWLPGTQGGVNGAYVQLALSGDVGPLRVGGMIHGQHTFAEGRDPLDVTMDLGATYRVVGSFRLGAEYVGQDLEESFSPGAEGGARHFLGPVASLQFWHQRVTVIGGPSVGLSSISPDLVARVAMSVGF
jgi:hypothetical protein